MVIQQSCVLFEENSKLNELEMLLGYGEKEREVVFLSIKKMKLQLLIKLKLH